MDFLQATHGFADFRWQDWVFSILGIGLCGYMFFVSPKLYPKVITRFERKHNVRITASPKAYKVSGPYPWLYLLWLEIKLLFTFMMVYFLPLLAIGLLGLLLEVFTT